MAASPPRVMPSSRSRRLRDEEPKSAEEVPESLPTGAEAPGLSMPTSTTFSPASIESPEERMFLLEGALLTSVNVQQKLQASLAACLELIPCEAASIAYGTINETELRFEVAAGPVAEQILGMTIPSEKGLVGACYATRQTLLIADVKASTEHMPGIDAITGFECKVALCVPILDDEGMVYGVIEMLNPTSQSFVDEDEEVIENVAKLLGNNLSLG